MNTFYITLLGYGGMLKSGRGLTCAVVVILLDVSGVGMSEFVVWSFRTQKPAVGN